MRIAIEKWKKMDLFGKLIVVGVLLMLVMAVAAPKEFAQAVECQTVTCVKVDP
jgi:hypothetical protein